MLSLGIEASRAFWIAVASAALPSGSPPPSRAATVIARASLVKSLPRLASAAPFLCLIEDHFECPDIVCHSMSVRGLAASFIFVVMLFAALALWTAIPVGWIYIASQIASTQFPAAGPYAVVAIGIPVSYTHLT